MPVWTFGTIQACSAENIMTPVKSNADIEPCLAVVMPVYNEADTIAEVVNLVLAQQPVQQLVIVDDASTDGTWEKLQALAGGKPMIQLARHAHNQGKGAALRTGFGLATAPLVIVQDADLEYDPGEYYLVLAPILAGRADVVFGSRFLGGSQGHRVLYYWHSVGNWLLTTLSNMATDLNLTDMETCYKAFRRELLQRIVIRGEPVWLRTGNHGQGGQAPGCASMKSPFPTMDGPTRKARRSAGRTGFMPCGAS